MRGLAPALLTAALLSPIAAHANGQGNSFLSGAAGGAAGGAVGAFLGNMFSRPAPPPQPAPPPGVVYLPAPTYHPRAEVAPDPTMMAVQRRLKELGFLPPTAVADGVAGPQTHSAIRAWQAAMNHPVTGFVAEAELSALLAPQTQTAVTTGPLLLAYTNHQILGQWSGQGSMTTPPFHADGPWELEWNASAGFVAELNHNGQDQGAVAQMSGPGQSSGTIPSGGDFTLRLEGPGRWVARVVALTAPAQPAPMPVVSVVPQPVPSPVPAPVPAPEVHGTRPPPPPPSYAGWAGSLVHGADGSVRACALETDFGHQGVVDGNVKITMDRQLQGTLALGRTAWTLPTGQVQVTAVFDANPDHTLRAAGTVGPAKTVLAALSDPNPVHTVSISFGLNDALPLMTRISKSVDISIAQQPDWRMSVANFYGALAGVQQCAMQLALPDIADDHGVSAATPADACPTDPAARVGWCIDPNPGRAGAVGYAANGLRRVDGLASPLMVGSGKRPLPPPEVERLAALSSYEVIAGDSGKSEGSLGSAVAVGPHTLLTNCHVVMWKSKLSPATAQAAPPPATAGATPSSAPQQAAPSASMMDEPLGAGAGGAPALSDADAPYDTVFDTIHVLAQGGDGTAWPAQVTAQDCQYDVAMLTTPADLFPVVGIRLFSDLARGEPAFALGAPLGMQVTFTTGVVANLLPHQQMNKVQFTDVDMVTASATITHGNSGGGLFDQYGDLIGLTESFLKDYPDLSFSVAISQLVRPAAKPDSAPLPGAVLH